MVFFLSRKCMLLKGHIEAIYIVRKSRNTIMRSNEWIYYIYLSVWECLLLYIFIRLALLQAYLCNVFELFMIHWLFVTMIFIGRFHCNILSLAPKNWVLLRFRSNSDLHAIQHILKQWKKNRYKKMTFFQQLFFFRNFFS